MREAHRLASRVWPTYAHEFSRHDFTLPQLFACLVVREMMKLSYRKAEALLRDSPHWLRDIGMNKPPDHNTLWRAFGVLVQTRRVSKMLDLLAELFAHERLLKLSVKPLTIDSTCYERRHRSRHYDRVCRKMQLRDGEKYANRPEKTGEERAATVNRARSLAVRQMPKLALAVAANCHLILAARTHTGNRSDAPDFEPLLYQSWRRAGVKTTVADPGYDSETNHCIARLDMGVRSIIPPKIGRPSSKPPAGRFRRLMSQRFARKADRRALRPTVAERDGQQHDEAQLRRRAAVDLAGTPRAGDAPSITHARPASVVRKVRVETEPELSRFLHLPYLFHGLPPKVIHRRPPRNKFRHEGASINQLIYCETRYMPVSKSEIAAPSRLRVQGTSVALLAVPAPINRSVGSWKSDAGADVLMTLRIPTDELSARIPLGRRSNAAPNYWSGRITALPIGKRGKPLPQQDELAASLGIRAPVHS